MTERYWQRYANQYYGDPLNSSPFWTQVKKDIDRRKQPKHHLELYSICKTDNPFIRQIKNSPNITVDTVAELICRDKGCELMYCLSLHKIAEENRRSKLDLQGCTQQYNVMTQCIQTEKQRILQKELELREKVYGIKTKEKEILEQQEQPMAQQLEQPQSMVMKN